MVRLEGIELSHTAPEAAALSTELQAYIGYANYYSIEWYEGQIFVIIYLVLKLIGFSLRFFGSRKKK